MNWGLEIRESHDLETHLNFKRDLTGSRARIPTMIRGRFRVSRSERASTTTAMVLIFLKRFHNCKKLSAITRMRNDLRKKEREIKSQIKELKLGMLAGELFKSLACGVSIVHTILLEMPSATKPLPVAFLNARSIDYLLTNFKLTATVENLEAAYTDVVVDFHSRQIELVLTPGLEGTCYINHALTNDPEDYMGPQIPMAAFPENYYALTTSLDTVSDEMKNLVIEDFTA